MGKHAQFVVGPAGSGKSTYCSTIQEHCDTIKRSVHCVNLDPAAEQFDYKVSVDIRDLISLDDVTEELEYGPNGGLVYCMEYLLENISWLGDELGDYDDDYLVIDCPGQIELFSHFTIMKDLVSFLQKAGYQVCAVYVMDCQFVQDPTKFFAGCLSAMSAMVRLELPHVNVLSKVDLLQEDDDFSTYDLERFLRLDSSVLDDSVEFRNSPNHKFNRLTKVIAELVQDFGMVGFIPLNKNDEESVQMLLMQIDHCIQYGEDLEVKEKDYD